MSGAKVEILESGWTSNEAKELFEHIQAEIAKVMALPDWIVGSPDGYASARLQAERATKELREEAVRLLSTYSYPRILIVADGRESTERNERT